MNTLANDLQRLSSAEEIFDYFGLPYERAVVDVSRLHVLKRFNQYLAQAGGIDVVPFAACRQLLARAHADFVNSSGVEEKVFPIFRAAQGEHRISIERLKPIEARIND